MRPQYSRRTKLLAAVMAATGLIAASAGVVLVGWVCFLLAERTPKAVGDWIALVFFGVIMVGFLVCIVVLLWVVFTKLKQRTT